MATFPPPAATRPVPRSETRLALVMNGGVSLAVWMGGVTHELDLLCRAFQDGAEDLPPGDRDAEVHAVWRELAAEADTRVVVDIVAGTSAGGLNGMVLATALARRAPLPDLRELWDKSAALSELREPVSRTSLLSGDAFRGKLQRELRAIGAEGAGLRPPQPVTLFVTATALDGRARSFTDGFENHFDVRDHRRLYRFRRGHTVSFRYTGGGWRFTDRETDDFEPADTAVLVEAARATASFPGAFAPVSEQPMLGNRVLPALVHNDRAGCVMDGGVLNNAPFMPVLEAVSKRRLDAPVRRRVVVFIVPSTGRLTMEDAGRQECEDKPWPGAVASALRYPAEADFRSSTEELGARLSTSIRDTQLDLFSRARESGTLAGRLNRTALGLLTEYRRNRARAVLLDVRRRLEEAETVTALVPAPEAGIAEVDALLAGRDPNWLPPARARRLTACHRGEWRWGLVTCVRVLQCLSNDLHELHRSRDELPPARRTALIEGAVSVHDLLEKAQALFDASDARLRVLRPVGGGISDDLAATLLQRVFEELAVPARVASLVEQAAGTYATALRRAGVKRWRPRDVVETCLAVEIATRVYAPPSKIVEPLTPDFHFLRLGPDAMSPLLNEDRFADIGDRKLYGLRFEHFGAFIHSPWRRSDFAWGRMDAAHHLLRLFPMSDDERRQWEIRLHRAILAAEAPAGSPSAVDWMRGNLEELKEPTDNGLLRKVRDTDPAAWRSLRQVARSSLRLLRVPWWARVLSGPARNAAWRAYLDDPRSVRGRVKRALVGTFVLVVVAFAALVAGITYLLS
ncbi:DUF3376 domain-containing protein [Streptomyces sp. NPDC018031]|uniref:DUF3376 domain-containing protein n=1 Tax=Streptomyces sp. NPDC018031 TaxID=3365033 RepID=UPI0037936C8E